MKRLYKVIAVVALVASLGLHWTLLQSVAWVSMLVRYSQHDSIAEAVTKTFDGKHPCALCQVVSNGKKSEQKEERQFSIRKIEIFYEAPLQLVLVAPSPVPVPRTIEVFVGCTREPPTPPPRVA